MTVRPQRPPEVPGAVTPRARDWLRILWWNQIGWWHGAARGAGPARAGSGLFAIAWWPLLPVLAVSRVILHLTPSRRYYMLPERDAVLAVRAARGTWHVEDHSAARPGQGRGQALRAVLLPVLAAEADARGVAIEATAADPRLARRYAEELPGLVDVGAARPRGRRLRRPPATAVEHGVR